MCRMEKSHYEGLRDMNLWPKRETRDGLDLLKEWARR